MKNWKRLVVIGSLAVSAVASQAARAEEPLRLQDLEVSQERRVSPEEFRALVSQRLNERTFGGGQVTSANYPGQVTSANYPDQITSANYPDQVTSGNYPNQVTAGNYGRVNADLANRDAEELPAPQLAQ